MKSTMQLIFIFLIYGIYVEGIHPSGQLQNEGNNPHHNILNTEDSTAALKEFKKVIGGAGIYNSPGLSHSHKSSWHHEDQSSWPHDYPSCGGIRQSPVALNTGTAIHITKSKCLEWSNYHIQHNYMTLRNTGHSVEASCTWTSTGIPMIRGGPLNGSYIFGGIHWHWGGDFKHGGEHVINEQITPLEMHIVHFSSKFPTLQAAIDSGESEALAVVGVLFKLSAIPNIGMAIITNAMQTATSEGVQNQSLPLGYLGLNFRSSYFTYLGSLTTPPCNEIVRWIVLKDPLHITVRELMVFQGILTNGNPLVDNYRHLQPLNNRNIYLFSNTHCIV